MLVSSRSDNVLIFSLDLHYFLLLMTDHYSKFLPIYFIFIKQN